MTSPTLIDFTTVRRMVQPREWNIALIGCGGTGSWLAPHIARLVKIAQEKQGRKIETMFCDPDVVLEKNCYRQNFSYSEIGANKAEALAFRLNAAWGLEIKTFSGPVSNLGYNYQILVGCVDNAAARRQIAFKADRSWWLDCGNSRDYGQVLLGRGRIDAHEKPFGLEGLCTWLPSPVKQHPELLEDQPPQVEENEVGLSCADLALQGLQSLSINARVAAEAADFLFRFLLTGDLRRYAAYISLEGGSSSSKYITDDNIRPYLT